MALGPAPAHRTLGPRAARGVVAALGLLVLAGCGSDSTTADDPAGSGDASTGDSASPSASTDPSSNPSTPADPGTAAPTEPTASATAFDLPACADIWVAGATLPGGYEGCLDADGAPVDGAGTYCEFGKPIFTYAGRFYAVTNGPVTQTDGPLRRDPQYRRAQRSCGG